MRPPPDWLGPDVAPVLPRAVSLSPSRAYDESVPARRAGRGGGEKAMARGVLMHRLLQALRDIPEPARRAAARRHLARRADLFSAQECESMIEQVSRVLDDPRFSALFA